MEEFRGRGQSHTWGWRNLEGGTVPYLGVEEFRGGGTVPYLGVEEFRGGGGQSHTWGWRNLEGGDSPIPGGGGI